MNNNKYILPETERLELVPLDFDRIKLFVYDMKSLEKELDFKYDATPVEGEFLNAAEELLELTQKDKENYFWHTIILLIRKEDRTAVGSACFMNVPDAHGETETGYGLGYKYEHNGYMTEAMRTLCDYAFEKGASYVIAETDEDGFASQRVLQRCGFKKYDRDETLVWIKRK